MANPLYGQNKSDKMAGSLVLCVESATLSSAGTCYVAAPVDCIVKEVAYVVNAALTTAKSSLTIKTPSGTAAGTHEIPTLAAIGDSGFVGSLTSNNTLKAGDAIEIENDAAPGAGQATFSVLCEVTNA
tara:strand:- start:25 stop:408 length:384 start_codon:yes stop_codon:yes gene_type:complete